LRVHPQRDPRALRREPRGDRPSSVGIGCRSSHPHLRCPALVHHEDGLAVLSQPRSFHLPHPDRRVAPHPRCLHPQPLFNPLLPPRAPRPRSPPPRRTPPRPPPPPPCQGAGSPAPAPEPPLEDRTPGLHRPAPAAARAAHPRRARTPWRHSALPRTPRRRGQ